MRSGARDHLFVQKCKDITIEITCGPDRDDLDAVLADGTPDRPLHIVVFIDAQVLGRAS